MLGQRLYNMLGQRLYNMLGQRFLDEQSADGFAIWASRTYMYMQVSNGTGPGVRKSERPLSVYIIHWWMVVLPAAPNM